MYERAKLNPQGLLSVQKCLQNVRTLLSSHNDHNSINSIDYNEILLRLNLKKRQTKERHQSKMSIHVS